MELLLQSFMDLQDPRMNRRKLHNLQEIIFICVCAIICGEEDYVGIELWAHDNESWLKEHIELANGIPSHDTMMRVFQLLDIEAFGSCFIAFTQHFRKEISAEIISLDGKCLCGSKDNRLGKKGIYMVGAWAKQNQLLLGQVKVDTKSNEITAIPKLLELLCVKSCIITIDSMGCQTAIAEKIIEKEADYVLAVKGNQPSLEEQIVRSFACEKVADSSSTIEKDHGRIEERKCEVMTDLKWIEAPERWKNLAAIAKITSTRTIVSSNKTSTEVRYFILSQAFTAEKTLDIIRSHWGIENQLHWSLDVTFNEDNNRSRVKNAAANFSFLQRIALNLLKKEPTKISLKHKRHRANRNTEYLEKILSNI